MAWCLSKSNVSGNSGLKDESAVEAPEVGRYCGRKVSALVIHCEQQALYSQLGINDPTQTGERVEELGDTFECVVLALDRHQERVRGRQRVDRQQI